MPCCDLTAVLKYSFSLKSFWVTSLALGQSYPDSKVHGANMGPTWVLSAPDGPHVGPMNFAIWDAIASVPVKQSWGIWVNKLQESNNNDSNNNKMMHTKTLCINHGTYCTLQRWHYPYCRQNTCCYSLPRHYLNSADVSSIRPNRTGSSVNFIKIYLFSFKEMLLKVAFVLSLSSWCLERWRRGGRFLELFY